MAPNTPALQPHHGVLTLSGYGLRVAVNRGHLVVEDGIGRQRRTARFSRVRRDLNRLIVIGHSGVVTFEALRWLHDVGTAFVQIGANGQLIAAAGPVGLNEPRLRRAQALASQNGVGLAIARELLHDKLDGQIETLRHLGAFQEAEVAVLSAREALPKASSPADLRVLEANAAAVYWDAWRNIPIHFARRDEPRVPTHWRTFGTRGSLLTGGPRKAINPANALLNYLYAIVEAEARLAALTVGCDPGLGLLHTDIRSRDSLACDLMEPVRPIVDQFVMDMLSARVFRKDEFFETREGVCRVLSPVNSFLAETAARWAKTVAPIAEYVARRLADSATASETSKRSRRPMVLPTPLTEAKRRTGRNALRHQPAGRLPASKLPSNCGACGTPIEAERRLCDSCLPSPLAAIGRCHSALEAKRAQGKDPAHGGRAAVARGTSISKRRKAIAEWEARNPMLPDSSVYVRDVFPRVRTVSVEAIVRATGLSVPYCAMIRRGLRVPHPMHWKALMDPKDEKRSP